MQDLDSQYRRQWFVTENGEKLEGVLLDADECKLPRDWWMEIQHRPRGRPELEPSLFGNSYKEEFEQVRATIVGSTGKQRGSIQQAIAILAKKYRIEPDAMRKRIDGRKIKRFDFRKE
jgi:hypothetical protein